MKTISETSGKTLKSTTFKLYGAPEEEKSNGLRKDLKRL